MDMICFEKCYKIKILSRIEGDESKTGTVLKNLQKIITVDFIKSNSKLKEMDARLQISRKTWFQLGKLI